MRAWTPFSATLAPVALIGGWSLAAARHSGGFDATSGTISALAAHGADDRWIMTTGLVLLGGAHVATALGLTEARPAGRVVLAAGGVSAVLVAVFAQPSPAHVPVATTSFLALTVWPALAAVPGLRTGWVAAGVLAALMAWFGLVLDGPRVGLAERVVAGAQALWPLAAVLAVRRRRRAGGTAAVACPARRCGCR